MIGHLRGSLLTLDTDRAILDVGGVGYEVRVPLSTYYELESSGDGGSEVRLLIHTQVRDDAIELYGFSTAREKAIFEKLISVSGIGPKLAQVALSGLPPKELIAALASGDSSRLTRIPGIGKKTADRMVLELRDAAEKMSHSQTREPEAAVAPASTESELLSALLSLGYRRREVTKAVEAVVAEHADEEFSELLRQSLRRLSKA